MDPPTRETGRLRSSAPCRLRGGTAARAALLYYPLFLGLHRDGESHPQGCLGERVTKVRLAPPTGPRPIGAPRYAGAELQRQPPPFAPGHLGGLCGPGGSPLQFSTSSGGSLMGKQPPILGSSQSSKQAATSMTDPTSQCRNRRADGGKTGREKGGAEEGGRSLPSVTVGSGVYSWLKTTVRQLTCGIPRS